MRSITRLSRPALAGVLGAALALTPSAALATDGAAPAAHAPTVSATLGVTAPGGAATSTPWDLGPRAQLAITSPRQGETVSPGNITFSGTAAPGSSVVATLSGPGDPGSPGWDTGEYVLVADASGRWSLTESLPDRGAYRFGIRNASLDTRSISFTVGTPTTQVPPPCEHWWCDKG